MPSRWALDIKKNDAVFRAAELAIKQQIAANPQIANPKIKKGTKVKLDSGEEITLEHSFIGIQQMGSDGKLTHVPYAIATKTITDEEKFAKLGEGFYGKVKLVQSKEGINYAMKIEGEVTNKSAKETERRICKAIGFVKGEVTRQLPQPKEYKGKQTPVKEYTVMELREGQELFNHLYANPLTPDALIYDPKTRERNATELTDTQKLILAIKCAQAIQDLHNRGVIHADIKPANFMANINGNMIVLTAIDFGCSHQLPLNQDGLPDPDGKIEHQDKPSGTPLVYMPPEVTQLNAAANIPAVFSKKSDIYSLGIMFQEDFGLPKEICARMLSQDPAERASMPEIIQVLSEALDEKMKALPDAEQSVEAKSLIKETQEGVQQLRIHQGPQQRETLVAQMVSGFRDPRDTLNSSKSTAYNTEDFNRMAFVLHSQIPPDRFYRELIDFIKNPAFDEEDRKTLLHNANLLIHSLINTNPSYLSVHEKSIEPFLESLKAHDPALTDELNSVRAGLQATIEQSKAKLEREKQIQIDTTKIESFTEKKPAAGDNILVSNIAADLKQMQLEVMRKINLADFHRLKWSKDPNTSLGNISKLFNNISTTVVNDILNGSSIVDQKARYEFYLDVAVKSLEINDMMSAMAILAGLNNSSINRLKYLQDPSFAAKLKDVNSALSTERSCKVLREKVAECEKSGVSFVPYIGMYQTDLTFMYDGNAERSKHGKDNEDRIAQQGEVLRIIQVVQNRAFSESNPSYRTDFATHASKSAQLSEDKLMEKSVSLSPRSPIEIDQINSIEECNKYLKNGIIPVNLRVKHKDKEVTGQEAYNILFNHICKILKKPRLDDKVPDSNARHLLQGLLKWAADNQVELTEAQKQDALKAQTNLRATPEEQEQLDKVNERKIVHDYIDAAGPRIKAHTRRILTESKDQVDASLQPLVDPILKLLDTVDSITNAKKILNETIIPNLTASLTLPDDPKTFLDIYVHQAQIQKQLQGWESITNPDVKKLSDQLQSQLNAAFSYPDDLTTQIVKLYHDSPEKRQEIQAQITELNKDAEKRIILQPLKVNLDNLEKIYKLQAELASTTIDLSKLTPETCIEWLARYDQLSSDIHNLKGTTNQFAKDQALQLEQQFKAVFSDDTKAALAAGTDHTNLANIYRAHLLDMIKSTDQKRTDELGEKLNAIQAAFKALPDALQKNTKSDMEELNGLRDIIDRLSSPKTSQDQKTALAKKLHGIIQQPAPVIKPIVDQLPQSLLAYIESAKIREQQELFEVQSVLQDISNYVASNLADKKFYKHPDREPIENKIDNMLSRLETLKASPFEDIRSSAVEKLATIKTDCDRYRQIKDISNKMYKDKVKDEKDKRDKEDIDKLASLLAEHQAQHAPQAAVTEKPKRKVRKKKREKSAVLQRKASKPQPSAMLSPKPHSVQSKNPFNLTDAQISLLQSLAKGSDKAISITDMPGAMQARKETYNTRKAIDAFALIVCAKIELNNSNLDNERLLLVSPQGKINLDAVNAILKNIDKKYIPDNVQEVINQEAFQKFIHEQYRIGRIPPSVIQSRKDIFNPKAEKKAFKKLLKAKQSEYLKFTDAPVITPTTLLGITVPYISDLSYEADKQVSEMISTLSNEIATQYLTDHPEAPTQNATQSQPIDFSRYNQRIQAISELDAQYHAIFRRIIEDFLVKNGIPQQDLAALITMESLKKVLGETVEYMGFELDKPTHSMQAIQARLQESITAKLAQPEFRATVKQKTSQADRKASEPAVGEGPSAENDKQNDKPSIVSQKSRWFPAAKPTGTPKGKDRSATNDLGSATASSSNQQNTVIETSESDDDTLDILSMQSSGAEPMQNAADEMRARATHPESPPQPQDKNELIRLRILAEQVGTERDYINSLGTIVDNKVALLKIIDTIPQKNENQLNAKKALSEFITVVEEIQSKQKVLLGLFEELEAIHQTKPLNEARFTELCTNIDAHIKQSIPLYVKAADLQSQFTAPDIMEVIGKQRKRKQGKSVLDQMNLLVQGELSAAAVSFKPDFLALAIKPVQRPPKYQLLSREFISFTPENSPMYQPMTDLNKSLGMSITQINEEKRRRETRPHAQSYLSFKNAHQDWQTDKTLSILLTNPKQNKSIADLQAALAQVTGIDTYQVAIGQRSGTLEVFDLTDGQRKEVASISIDDGNIKLQSIQPVNFRSLEIMNGVTQAIQNATKPDKIIPNSRDKQCAQLFDQLQKRQPPEIKSAPALASKALDPDDAMKPQPIQSEPILPEPLRPSAVLSDSDMPQSIEQHGLQTTSVQTPKPPTPSSPLVGMLRTADIPEQVKSLALRGKENYDAGKITALDEARSGGRVDGWINQTFGEDESQLISRLDGVPPPKTYKVGEIQQAYISQEKRSQTDLPTFTIVQGVSANDLHRRALGKNAVMQVASQFDFQESMGAYDTPVTGYRVDPTQGPQASIEAAAAALHRKAAKHSGSLQHALSEVIPDSILNKAYKHGYLMLNKLSENEKRDLLAVLQDENKINQLSILPQWVICEASGEKQLQVFTAAPSFQGASRPEEGSLDDLICKRLMVAQYVATAQLAVIRSREIGATVPLHLTLVGQGAFNNNPTVMKEAMAKVAEIVKGENVAVYVHAYSVADTDKLKTQMEENVGKIFHVNNVDKEQFKSMQLPTPVQPSWQSSSIADKAPRQQANFGSAAQKDQSIAGKSSKPQTELPAGKKQALARQRRFSMPAKFDPDSKASMQALTDVMATKVKKQNAVQTTADIIPITSSSEHRVRTDDDLNMQSASKKQHAVRRKRAHSMHDIPAMRSIQSKLKAAQEQADQHVTADQDSAARFMPGSHSNAAQQRPEPMIGTRRAPKDAASLQAADDQKSAEIVPQQPHSAPRRSFTARHSSMSLPPMDPSTFTQTKNLTLEKLYDHANKNRQTYDIKDIKRYEADNGKLEALKFDFDAQDNTGKQVSSYAHAAEDQNVKFSISKKLADDDEKAAEEAILRTCQLAVDSAGPNAEFTIPAKLAPESLRQKVEQGFEKAIKNAIDAGKFTEENKPKIVQASQPGLKQQQPRK